MIEIHSVWLAAQLQSSIVNLKSSITMDLIYQ